MFPDGVNVRSVPFVVAPNVNGVGFVLVVVVLAELAPNVNGLAVAAGCWLCPNVKPVDGVDGFVAPNVNGEGFGGSLLFAVGVSLLL